MKKLILFFSWIFVLGQGISQTRPRSIVVLGSSSARGYFGNPPLFPYDSSAIGRLSNFYKTTGVIDTIFNLSESSTNIYQSMPSWYQPTGEPRLTYINFGKNITAAIALRPQVILVYYPTNGYDYFPEKDVMECYRTIKATADSAGIPIFMFSTQPRGNLSVTEHQKLINLRDSIKNNFGSRAIMIYDKLAKPTDIRYMNPEFWLGYPNNLATAYMDSVHMNSKGHSIVFQEILAAKILTADAGLPVPLPVKVVNFSGVNNTDGNLLNWSVTDQSNFSGFDLERSLDTINFLKIGFIVSSQPLAGGISKYQFLDKNLNSGTRMFYRLKVINADGSFKYSQVLMVEWRNTTGFNINSGYPNPVSSIYSVSFNSENTGNVILSINDETGRLIRRQSFHADKGSNCITVNVSVLPTGNYVIALYNVVDGNSATKMIIKR